MIQYTASSSSPFVRKVALAVAIKGLSDRVIGVTAEANSDLNREIRTMNPLYKIPSMMLADGSVIHDSHVICEYVDTLAPSPRLFPEDPGARIRTLTLGSLGDGIIEAALAVVMEGRFRPKEMWVQSWVDRQLTKVDGGVQWLERNIPKIDGSPDYGHLTIASALGYLDFREVGTWRNSCPRLVAWLEGFAAAVPAFTETMPPK